MKKIELQAKDIINLMLEKEIKIDKETYISNSSSFLAVLSLLEDEMKQRADNVKKINSIER